MSVGGSIQECSIKGRIFSVAADADASRKLGGYENEVVMNGDRSARVIKTAGGWSLSGLVLDINDIRGDQEYLQSIANGDGADPDGFFDVSVTFASGATYSGRGIVVDTIEWSSQSTTAGVSLAGPGELTKQ